MTAPLTDPAVLDKVRRRLLAELPELVGDHRVLDDRALAAARQQVLDEIHGAGPLAALLERPDVTDVLVNGPYDVWIEAAGRLQRATVSFADEAAVRRVAVRLAVSAGRRLDDASPWVDAALPGGVRLHAVLPPLTENTTMSLRVLRPPPDVLALLPAGPRELLTDAIVAGRNVLVTGATGSGKTTLLAALLGQVPGSERIVVVEDTAELQIAHPHVVRLVTRTPNVEGVGGVPLEALTRQALRMRPDRLVVGEFRGAETGVALAALTAGHRGAATVHAHGLAGVPARLLALGALAGLDPRTVTALAAAAFDVVVAVERVDGVRAVSAIGRLAASDIGVRVDELWSPVVGERP